ncbi:MAG: sortase [Oscillospiraceae bacterium]|nr:sortase [Oscillospiraceae bacterium]
MKNNTWKLVVLLGLLMILSAGVLCVNNIQESKDAAQYAGAVLSTLKERIPEAPADSAPDSAADTAPDLFAEYGAAPESSEASAEILLDDAAYCGYLELPALEIELPVQSSWSYPALKKTPCRYSGSAETNDLIIAAHNYASHFGRIGELTAGDPIIFTDAAGKKHEYAVSFMEVIAGQDVAQMFSGSAEDWDLTLYTCTLSGQSRVTVRADRITEETDEKET